jgi:hypothetical protein
MKKVVLAYSGGLDTSCAIKWLQDKGYEVIAVIADVGQGENFEAVKERALKTGAGRVHVLNLQKEFVTDYVFPAIKANAIYENKYLLATALSRPIIAKHQVKIAHRRKYQSAVLTWSTIVNKKIIACRRLLQIVWQFQILKIQRSWQRCLNFAANSPDRLLDVANCCDVPAVTPLLVLLRCHELVVFV